MAYYDIFNGDADGLTALPQLRLAEPQASTLITGVKRDIALVKQVQAQAGDVLTVLDISLEKNLSAVRQALSQGARVFYMDHHAPGDVFEHPALQLQINTAADVCTSLLMNGHLRGAYPLWAIVGACGDNLHTSAQALANTCRLSAENFALLKELGTLLNYNAYGFSLEDLHFTPQALFTQMSPFASPLEFIEERAEILQQLRSGYADDMAQAEQLRPHVAEEHCAVFILPSHAWARRVNGVWGNQLANQYPQRAHAVLVEKTDASYLVSVRAPLTKKQGAGTLCSRFATGGGREAAAGINALPVDKLDNFVEQFTEFFAKPVNHITA